MERPMGPSREELERGIEAANARLRHFRGIAASVMNEALGLWKEIWDDLQDARSCAEIMEDFGDISCSSQVLRQERRSMVLEKLHLLGIQIDYARRLCEGSIGNTSREKGERDHGERAQSRLDP